MKKLTGKQLSHLRSLGHHLTATAMMGREGITKSLLQSISENLTAHELIKVKVQENCPMDRKEAAAELAKQSRSHLVQIIGRTFLLYKENPKLKEDRKIVLPC